VDGWRFDRVASVRILVARSVGMGVVVFGGSCMRIICASTKLNRDLLSKILLR